MSRRIISCLFSGVLSISLSVLAGYAHAAAWTPDMDCSVCHDKHVKSMKDGTKLANTHVKAGVDKCTGCHDEAALKDVHAKAEPDQSFVKARRYPKDFCLKCHGTYEDLAKRTANSKALTDVKGRVVNPHDLPKTPAHKKMGECSICHSIHNKSTDAMKYCVGCHHKHEFACASCHSNK